MKQQMSCYFIYIFWLSFFFLELFCYLYHNNSIALHVMFYYLHIEVTVLCLSVFQIFCHLSRMLKFSDKEQVCFVTHP